MTPPSPAPPESETILCDVCGTRPSTGVAAVPGVPLSAAYCVECLAANAHPWDVLVANTATLGGMAEAAGWWVTLVDCTCVHLGRTRREFNEAVAESMAGDDQVERTDEPTPPVKKIFQMAFRLGTAHGYGEAAALALDMPPHVTAAQAAWVFLEHRDVVHGVVQRETPDAEQLLARWM